MGLIVPIAANLESVPRSGAGVLNDAGDVLDDAGNIVEKIADTYNLKNLMGNTVNTTSDVVSSSGDVLGKIMPIGQGKPEEEDDSHDEGKSEYTTQSKDKKSGGLGDTVGSVIGAVGDTAKEATEGVGDTELGTTAIPVAASSPLELDKLASTLVSLLQSAAKAAGRSARKGARNAPWWTEECALAAAGYQAIRKLYPLGFNQEVQITKRDFHHVVRHAKRLYWRNLINSFSDSSSVFKAVRWLRSPGAFQPPPLQVDDIVYETQLDKANALRRATLERRTAEDDIQDP
uniref:Uncharacterized protein n=1 Tax=Fusarium oxysporum (strain Fo5176) TaxID=660025 RepID=A0A0D2XT82_FUSOF